MASPSVTASVLLMYSAMPVVPQAVSPVLQSARSPVPAVESWQSSEPAQLVMQREADAQLAAICSLEENWDGYAGASVHADTASNAKLALRTFLSRDLFPDLVPNSNGTISFEWTSARGEAVIEVGKTRFVGVIRPKGAADYPIAGETGTADKFKADVMAIAAVVAAALFPRETPPDTQRSFTAGYARRAA